MQALQSLAEMIRFDRDRRPAFSRRPADDFSASLGSGFTQALMPSSAGVDVQTDLPTRIGVDTPEKKPLKV